MVLLPLSFKGVETFYLFRLTHKNGGKADGVLENPKRLREKNVTQVVYGDTVSAFLILSCSE